MFGHQDNQIDDLPVEPLLAMDNAAWAADGSNLPTDNNSPRTDSAAVTSPVTLSPIPLPDNDIPPPQGTASTSSLSYDDDKSTPANSPDDLMAIKQQALQQLNPLLGHLDQTPEEKFRTTMMMIQAADNKSLIPEAFRAAQKITDEKVQAQALLDVVNEINYFSQQKDKSN
jgi:hypothetical protein